MTEQKQNGLGRRLILKSGAAFASIAGLGCATSSDADSDRSLVFRTPLCDLLGIDYPVVQAGMGAAATPQLAAAVSNAGGLGIVSASWKSPEVGRKEIQATRDLTERRFGVNLLVAQELREPVPASAVTAEVLAELERRTAPLRDEVGASPLSRPLVPVPDRVNEVLEMILEERPAVLSLAMGDLGKEWSDRFHEVWTKIITMVTTLGEARVAAASGADAIVAQGTEAGGFRSQFKKAGLGNASREGGVSTLPLLRELATSIRTPLIAAGGITDGHGLVAALALGAQGVLMGSRFAATRESKMPGVEKQAMVDHRADETILTNRIAGCWSRVLTNRLSEFASKVPFPVLPFPLHGQAFRRPLRNHLGDGPEYRALWGGQSVGTIQGIPDAAQIVRDVVEQAHDLLSNRLHETVTLS